MRQRARDERGATSVVVALLMVVLMGFAAISIDVAAMYGEKQELQTGADAAAFAIAQDCARGACGTPSQTAQTFAVANLNSHDHSTATITTLTSSTVTVRNSGTRALWFAPVLGLNSATITANSTVGWGAPQAGTAMLPLAFSWCEWQAQTGGGLPSGTAEHVILFPKKSDTGCTGPSSSFVPGGFGWLDTDPGTCKTTSAIANHVGSSTGNTPSNGCSPADLVALQGQTVLLPLFNDYGGNGSNAWYQIYGYAAFKITGYYLAGQYNWGSPCGGSERCIRGYFTSLVDLNSAFSYGSTAPQFGASIVRLTK